MRAGIWVYENYWLARIDCYFVGDLELTVKEGGLVDLTLTSVRKHGPETSFGRQLPKDLPEGTTHWQEVEPISFTNLRIVSEVPRCTYMVTEDDAQRVVIDREPPP